MLNFIFQKRKFWFSLILVIVLLTAFSNFFGPKVLAQKIETLNELENLAEKIGLKKQTDLVSIVGVLVKSLLSLLGIVFLILVIYGGIQWMTSAGNEEQIKKAKGLIVNAVIGLAVVVLAYAIASFIVGELLKVA